MLRALWALLFLLAACRTAEAPAPPKALPSRAVAPTVAVTIDDLPWMGPAGRGAEGVTKILAALEAFDAPATGFVTCSRVDEHTGAMSVWRESRIPLGNHSSSHKSIDAIAVDEWLDDVMACGQRLPKDAEWFRYPFLQHGRTIETKDRAARALAQHGYEIAHVSIDTADWAFDRVYGEALERGDREAVRAIADAYVEHVTAAAQRYRRIAMERIGRDVAHVLLLHANRINADALGRVLASLSRAGFRFIGLKEALADPVYRMRDEYVGPIGMSWLYRIGQPRPDLWRWDEAQIDSVEVRFGDDTVRIRHDMTVRRLAPKVYLVVHEKPWPANILLVDMDDLVLVSTPYTYEATRTLLAWMRDAFGDRRVVAVSTHFHWDGAGGIGALREAGVPVHGSDLTVEALRARGERMRRETLAGSWKDANLRREFERTKLEAPSRVFAATRGLELTIGGEKLVAFWPGAGHSPDNLVVWFPARGVLFGGCLLKAGHEIGNLSDADVDAWPDAVRALQRFPARVVVPGHGAPGDLALLDNTLAVVAKAP